VDIALPEGGTFSHPLDSRLNAFIYVYEGSVKVGAADAPRPLKSQSAGFLSPGDRVEVRADAGGARFLLLAGRPLKEPIAQYGPFVMNTVEEIEQAIADFQSGKFTQAAA